jgi:hypothetical protein
MRLPKIVDAPECPGCSGAEWKLAKMVVLGGTVNVDTESDGGGFGVSAGLGRGQGGIGVNYQGLDVSTTGTHTQAAAAAYAPPNPPDQYEKKDDWLEQVNEDLKLAVKNIVEIDKFGTDPSRLEHGFFQSKGSDYDIRNSEKRFIEARVHLVAILNYEKRHTLWEKTRVCTRCGEAYILKQDAAAYHPSFKIPEFQFEGQDRKCPSCKSYCWKRADIYFQLLRTDLERQIAERKKSLDEALEYEKNPNANASGFWSKLGKKLFTLKPDQSSKLLAEVSEELEQLDGKSHDLEKAKGALDGFRICLSCRSPY